MSKSETGHECQCQEHDCTKRVECDRPAHCQRSTMLHLCPECYTHEAEVERE